MFFNRTGGRLATISAHPDDETLGAGGTIARLVESGYEFFSCVVTQGYEPDWGKEQLEKARREAEEALRVLGVEEVRFLGFPTVKLNIVPHKDLVDAISRFVKDIEPDIILTPSYIDINPDHSIVARAAAVAVKPAPSRAVTLMQYEVPSSSEWGGIMLGERFTPNLYVCIADFLDTKLRAVSCFSQELKEYPHPRSLEGVRKLAEMRGIEVGQEVAEAFKLVVHVE